MRARSSCGINYSCRSSQVVLDDGADITVGVGEPVGCNAPSVLARLRGWLDRLRDGGRDARAMRGVQEALQRRRFLEQVVCKFPVISGLSLISTPTCPSATPAECHARS